MASAPPWLFPTPVRRSRFVAEAPEWRPFNIEVAFDRIAPFAFDGKHERQVLFFDYQTGIGNNTPGRLGSVNAGIFRDYYVKGVGRTQAAGNWNDPEDGQGSGHLSVAAALRERLITAVLQGRGLGDAIVPCESVLIDTSLMALSTKPADFARISNVVWALDQFSSQPDHIGRLFLEFERYLNPPDRREGLSGEPAAIARAMDQAFRRGLANFRRFEEVGLFWIHTNGFTLDGRQVDLETPLYFGAPFVGAFDQKLVGFEYFSFVKCWRLFVLWLKEKLRYLVLPGIIDMPIVRSFLRETARQIRAVFSPGHLLYADDLLQKQAVSSLAGLLDPGRKGRAQISELARYAFEGQVNLRDLALPDLGWRDIDFRPAPVSPAAARITVPAFFNPGVFRGGEAFAEALKRLGAQHDPQEMLKALTGEVRAFMKSTR